MSDGSASSAQMATSKINNPCSLIVQGTSENLLWEWGAEKIPAGEAINAKPSGDSGPFSNEDSGDFIKH
ncbi:MAG: hypothetical protein ACI957_003991 [Verrucomicrobiales bacterium]|jgi:hypothetical protein